MEAGYLGPARTKDLALDRIVAMCGELERLVAGQVIHRIVLEIPSGKVHARRHLGGGAGLSVYGMAAGAILWAAVKAMGGIVSLVCCVKETEWTRGVPKGERQRRVALAYPAYREAMGKDSPGDVADAIGLGDWWYAKRTCRSGG